MARKLEGKNVATQAVDEMIEPREALAEAGAETNCNRSNRRRPSRSSQAKANRRRI
jgi:hypothetical protein